MAKFSITADAEFNVDEDGGIVEAFVAMAKHFLDLAYDGDSQIITNGWIKIAPAKESQCQADSTSGS